jgi:hypothetical protein
MKIGRNQPCPCGSGKKHKNCCGRPLNRATSATFSTDRPDIAKLIDRRRAEDQIREDQQGLGRPIIAFKANDQQFVAVANTVFWLCGQPNYEQFFQGKWVTLFCSE